MSADTDRGPATESSNAGIGIPSPSRSPYSGHLPCRPRRIAPSDPGQRSADSTSLGRQTWWSGPHGRARRVGIGQAKVLLPLWTSSTKLSWMVTMRSSRSSRSLTDRRRGLHAQSPPLGGTPTGTEEVTFVYTLPCHFRHYCRVTGAPAKDTRKETPTSCNAPARYVGQAGGCQ
jgi:hypothetical protein